MVGEALVMLCTPMLSVPPEPVAVTSVMLGEEEILLRTPLALVPPEPRALTSFIAGEEMLRLYTPRLAAVAPKAVAVTCSRLGDAKLLKIATASAFPPVFSTVSERSSAL